MPDQPSNYSFICLKGRFFKNKDNEATANNIAYSTALVFSLFLPSNFVLPPYSCTLTCNVVNVYTIRYHVYTFNTRAHSYFRLGLCKILKFMDEYSLIIA